MSIRYLKEIKEAIIEDDEVRRNCNEFITKLEFSVKKLDKILVSIDGSKESFDAVDYGLLLAGQFNAVMTAIHVLSQDIGYEYDNKDKIQTSNTGTPNKYPEIIELLKQEVQEKWFDKIIEKAKEMDVNIQTDIITNTRFVASEIVDYADKLDAGLIIVGTRGRSRLKKMLLGRVATEVIKYANCPVLIVK